VTLDDGTTTSVDHLPGEGAAVGGGSMAGLLQVQQQIMPAGRKGQRMKPQIAADGGNYYATPTAEPLVHGAHRAVDARGLRNWPDR
jgi:hypothetical protein